MDAETNLLFTAILSFLQGTITSKAALTKGQKQKAKICNAIYQEGLNFSFDPWKLKDPEDWRLKRKNK